ncbi:MAG: Bax inhibitor-1/YccA family protein [Deltaproteobacteria bacterium]|nr:Bax inhibitor-1/YccA family protein [Deltaproteobacteria bacterium]
MFEERPTEVVSSRAEVTNAFLRGVYLWMACGLGITAVFAFLTISSETLLRAIVFNKFVFYGLIIGELVLVVALSSAIHKLSSAAASGLFILYSVLNGMTLSVVLLAYTSQSVFTAFLSTAGMFGAMSLYGLVTKRDLTGMGSFMTMGLFGILIAMVVNMFLGSGTMDLIISVLGVFIFLGLTAYDTQAIRNMGESAPMDDELAIRRGTIMGALKLYLDFINIFLMLLRLFGSRR